MNCRHCGDLLSHAWHLPQEDLLPDLQVGSLVVATETTGVCDRGERGVVYEAYENGGRPGWSVIFQGGRHDGFTACDAQFFLTVTGEVCQELTGYAFENVTQLADDFGRGRFAPALGAEGRQSIFRRWLFPS